MTVSLRSLPTTIRVGGVDFSSAFVDYQVSVPHWNRTGIASCTGSLSLSPYNGPESLDPWLNPSRFFEGQVVEIFHDFNGTLVPLPWRLLITGIGTLPRVDARANPRNLTLNIGDDFALRRRLAPEGNAGVSDPLGSFRDRTVHINNILSKVGLGPLVDSIPDYPLRYSAQKNTSGSWIKMAGDLAYTANYVLWQQADGAIRASRFDNFTGLPSFNIYTVGADEGDFDRISDGEPSSSEFIVSGSTTTYDSIRDYNNQSDIFDNGSLVGRIISYSSGRGGSSPTFVTEKYAQASEVIPGVTSNALILDERETVAQDFSSISGVLNEEVITVEEPVGKIIPEGSWPNPGNVIISYRETTTYDYDRIPSLQTKGKTQRIEEPGYLVNPVSFPLHTNNPLVPRTAAIVSDRWEGDGADDLSHTRGFVNRRLDGKTSQTGTTTGAIVQRPAVTYSPPRYTSKTATYTDSVTLDKIVTSPYEPEPRPLTMPRDMVTSKAQCRALALIEGTVQYGRSRGCELVAPITQAYLQGWSPVRRFDAIDINQTRAAYLIDSQVIGCDTRESTIVLRGLELATIGTPGAGSVSDLDGNITSRPFIEALSAGLGQTLGAYARILEAPLVGGLGQTVGAYSATDTAPLSGIGVGQVAGCDAEDFPISITGLSIGQTAGASASIGGTPLTNVRVGQVAGCRAETASSSNSSGGFGVGS